jgi:transcriptional regulator with XRE-family HTH domain
MINGFYFRGGREARGFSRKEISRLLGISTSAIARLENCRTVRWRPWMADYTYILGLRGFKKRGLKIRQL